MMNSEGGPPTVRTVWVIPVLLMALLAPVTALAQTCDRSEGAAAIPNCQQALQADPEDIEALLTYADILIDLGRPGEAVELLETSQGENPTDNSVRLKLSNAREAAAIPAKEAEPSSRAIQRLNVLQCKTRVGQAALNGCYSALEQHPLDVELLIAKGDALMVLERYDEAAETYQVALTQDKDNAVIQSKLEQARAAAAK